ncbi:hypothetical protein [uncultured Jatrophihabitans sp.]|uniref:hypothetical protein n=1 Tax=uncultured Jatrophihabitans sp. TaxID=1610747 RepID=UPI0035CA6618
MQAHSEPVHPHRTHTSEVAMPRPIVVAAAAAVAGLVAAVGARRRQAQADAELLWREATADASR